MNSRKLLLAGVVVTVYLILVNAVVFPLVFPDGLAEKLANARPEPKDLFHLWELIATAVLLIALVTYTHRAGLNWRKGLMAGILLGLLVALPEHLHLYAMVEASAFRQFVPALWAAGTWGIAGSVAGALL